MRQYLDLLKDIVENGVDKGDRTGTGTRSVFGRQLRFDLQEGFPLLTTKKMFFRGLVEELLWMLRGETNVRSLQEKGVNIWNEWSDEYGSIGNGYGKQWICWEKIDLREPRVYTRVSSVPHHTLVAGVGINGDHRKNYPEWVYSTWNEMLHRCYDDSRKHYIHYGGRGIFVDKRWHDFKTFAEDIKKLENYYLKLEYPDKYSLDKDYYVSNRYGPDDCIWASEAEQNINTKNAKVYRVIAPDGKSWLTMNLSRVLLDYNLDRSTVYKVIRGERRDHKGFCFNEQPIDGNTVPRIRIYNQIRQAIATIKHNPDCRRNIVTAWNPAEIEDMQLPPCHCFFQFYVADGKLSCQLYQRSCDVFLGVPFNIASYALLTHIIAYITELEPGEFIHTYGDVHIYKNHFEQVLTQLNRKPRHLPYLLISPVCGIIDDPKDFQFEHFTLGGYSSHPAIKAPVSV